MTLKQKLTEHLADNLRPDLVPIADIIAQEVLDLVTKYPAAGRQLPSVYEETQQQLEELRKNAMREEARL